VHFFVVVVGFVGFWKKKKKKMPTKACGTAQGEISNKSGAIKGPLEQELLRHKPKLS